VPNPHLAAGFRVVERRGEGFEEYIDLEREAAAMLMRE
jgi:hypothetical protein